MIYSWFIDLQFLLHSHPKTWFLAYFEPEMYSFLGKLIFFSLSCLPTFLNSNITKMKVQKLSKFRLILLRAHFIYHISSNSFRRNYSFLNLEIQRSQHMRPKFTVHKCVETIQGRKLFKGGNYMSKYGILTLKIMGILLSVFLVSSLQVLWEGHKIWNHLPHDLMFT